MAHVFPFSTFVGAHRNETREQFLDAVAAPYLYFPNLPQLPDEPAPQFGTIRITPGLRAGMKTTADLTGQGIVELKKDIKLNAFGIMITLGRAQNNDLVVPDSRVSKFHAYFRQVGEQWSITDANSTNGTIVDGISVPPERSHNLKSGALIELSNAINVQFLLPEELYARVRGAVSG